MSTPQGGDHEPAAAPVTPVERLDVEVYTIPTDAPEADGTLAWNATTMLVVTAYAEGVRGLGWSYTLAAAGQLVTGTLADVVVGRDALDVPGTNAAMARAVRNVGACGLTATAIAAVDIALWDLKARLLDVSLPALLGRCRERVPVYGSGGFTTYDDRRTTSQLAHWIGDLGMSRVKIKIGESWGADQRRDLARVAMVGRFLDDAAELFVDANGGYRTGQAVRVAHAMDDLGVTWFEEPVSGDDLAGLALVRGAISQDVAAGEYVWNAVDAGRLLAAGAVDCLQLDATRCGGYTGFLRCASLAAAANVDVSAHCAPHLHAPVCAAVPNLRHVEYFHDHERIETELLDGVSDPREGALLPDPDAPGHGYTFRHEAAERYRAA